MKTKIERVLIIFSCILLMHFGVAQESRSDSLLIEIEGILTEIKQSQDDISFYTWSLYLTLDTQGEWEYIVDASEVKPTIELLQKYCADFQKNKLLFNKNGFYNENEIKNFTGDIKKGKKITIYVLKSSLENFFKGQKCMIQIESIKKKN